MITSEAPSANSAACGFTSDTFVNVENAASATCTSGGAVGVSSTTAAFAPSALNDPSCRVRPFVSAVARPLATSRLQTSL